MAALSSSCLPSGSLGDIQQTRKKKLITCMDCGSQRSHGKALRCKPCASEHIRVEANKRAHLKYFQLKQKRSY